MIRRRPIPLVAGCVVIFALGVNACGGGAAKDSGNASEAGEANGAASGSDAGAATSGSGSSGEAGIGSDTGGNAGAQGGRSTDGGMSTTGGSLGGEAASAGASGSSAQGGQTLTGGTAGASAGGGSNGGGSEVGGGSDGGASGFSAGGIGPVGGGSSDGGAAGAAQGGSSGNGAGGVSGASEGGAAGTSAQGGTSGSASSGGSAGNPLDWLPPEGDVLGALRLANGYFVNRWPDPTVDIVTDKTRPSNLWTRAVYYEGLMGLYSVETDEARKSDYYDYAVTWASSPSHPWTMTYTAAGSMTTTADNQACGQTYIDLYQIDPQPERIAVIKANIDYMVDNLEPGTWWWIDAIQMSMPIFAKLGVLYDDTTYFDAMWWYYSDARDTEGGGLRNDASGLWWRDNRFSPGGTEQVLSISLNSSMPTRSSTDSHYILAPNGEDMYWSRGEGWVFAALTRVLDVLPASDSHHPTYVSDFQSLAAALVPLQRSDGFWNESLSDPTHCATIELSGRDGPETSGTALFAYGIAWGIRNGLLDAATYGPVLESAWTGLSTTALQNNGLLGYVQDTGDRPCTGPQLGPKTLANFDDYGVGCFLLAGTEVYKLAAAQ